VHIPARLAQNDVACDNPSQASNRKDGEPSTVSLTHPHNRNGGEEHKVVRFCEEMNNGFHNLLSFFILS